MTPRILLVNPPIYDFAAYDFWLKPYGLLSVAGYLRGKGEFALFDYLDRLHPFYSGRKEFESDSSRRSAGPEPDQWGRGKLYFEKIPSPSCLKNIPRSFRRFGLPQAIFQKFLAAQKPCDFVLVEAVMPPHPCQQHAGAGRSRG